MDIHFKDNDQVDQVLEVLVNDNSYRYRAIMGDNSLMLYFSMVGSMEDQLRLSGGLPVGAWCEFQGQRYTLEKPENFKMHNSRNFEYTMIMDGSQATLNKYRFRNIVDKRLKFSVTFQPKEHLQMLIDNLQLRDPEWKMGRFVHAAEKEIVYNHTDCLSALNQIAQAFDTEWEIEGKTIHLGKVEYNSSNPLALAYGQGNGLKSGVGRTNFSDSNPIEVLYVQGGEKNIDPSVYGNKELLLPRGAEIEYDGKYFRGEDGFLFTQAKTYISDQQGFSIRQTGTTALGAEGSLDLSHIYPQRVGTVSKVITVDEETNKCDFVDDSIPEGLDYAKYQTAGDKITVIFQSGELAGKEFEVNYFHEPKGNKLGRRFEIVPQDIDGSPMPGGTFVPKGGVNPDKYAVFGIGMPKEYIRNDADKSGAEWDMMREGVKHLCDNQVQKFSFIGELDGIWAKKKWLEVGGKIRLGGFISFSDERFQREPVLIRIVGVKDMINNPHSPQIELSNKPISASFLTNTVSKVESQEVVVEQKHSEALQFTKRRFRDAQETAKMLEGALLNFSGSVNPITVNTMQLLVGDKSLQFQFVDNKTNPNVVTHNVTYDKQSNKIKAPAGILQHMTLGVNLTSSHKASDYQFWDIAAYESPALDEPSLGYYLYVLCEQKGTNNRFLLSKDAKTMESVAGYYCFLYGVVNSEFDGERSFVPLNGFTEIMPGRITVPMIVSSDGNTYFDVAKGKIGGNIVFQSTSGKEKTVTELEVDAAKDATAKANSALTNALKANAILEETIIDGGYIRTELINTDTLEARIVNTRLRDRNDQSVGAGVMMGRGTSTLKVYDLDSKLRINLQGGVEGNYVPFISVMNDNGILDESTSLSPTDLSISSRDYRTNYHKDGFYCARRNSDNTYRNTVSLSKDGIYLPSTATVNMPGVLCAGRISKTGVLYPQWGATSCTAAPYLENGIRKMGYFKITHSLNHTNYFLQITGAELWNGVEPIIIGTVISKGRNEAIVAISGSNSKTFVDAAFEFCLIGQGKQ